MSILIGPHKMAASRTRGRRAGLTVLSMVLALLGLQIGLAKPESLLDPTFGKDGRVITKLAGANNIILATALASDGSIFAAGSGKLKHRKYAVIAKYTTDGTLDPSFGQNGKITDDDMVAAQAVALQPDGMILAAGVSPGFATGGPAFALKRYTADGSADPTFGSGGIVLDSIGPAGDFIDSIVLQPNGQILIGGNTVIVVGTRKHNQAINGDFALARYNTDGSADTSFGNGGKVTTDFAGNFDSVKQILVQPNSDILAAGQAGVPASSLPGTAAPAGSVAVLGFARYNVDGSLDASFGNQGLVTVAVDNVGTQLGSVALEANGQIFAAGATDLTFALVRLNSDGSPDSSFGQGGQSFIPLLDEVGCVNFTACNAVFSGAMAISFQPDGTILIYGGIGSESVHLFALSYTQDGALNTSFGTGGILTGKFIGVGEINSLIVQPDGKVVVAGRAKIPGSRNQFALGRFTVPTS
jgi:uncharacterized delta-60 repeat protein